MFNRRQMLEGAAGLAAAATGGPLLGATSAAAQSPADALRGKVFYKGEERYEPLRQAGVWNARKPERYPNGIVMAESVEDVIAAVKLAKEKGWKICVRSGGHSWDASNTRDNALQINLARLKQLEIDPEKKIAIISPSTQGQDLNVLAREKYKLMTTTAHGHGVGMGGFVMCGGHAWNSRKWGVACENLVALDVVTPDGVLIHADEKENSDWYWAARGAGPGFFGVAVRYYMRLHPFPDVQRLSMWMVPPDNLEETLHWMHANQHKFPDYMEVTSIGMYVGGRKVLRVSAVIFAHSEEEVEAAHKVIEACPTLAKAPGPKKMPVVIPPPVEMPGGGGTPTGARYFVDSAWSNADAATLVPFFRKYFDNMPTEQSFIYWQSWAQPASRKAADMAFSLEAATCLSPTSVSMDPATDAAGEKWVVDFARDSKPFSIGSKMNDDNMVLQAKAGVKVPYLSAPALARLKTLQAKYDPNKMFGFMVDV